MKRGWLLAWLGMVPVVLVAETVGWAAVGEVTGVVSNGGGGIARQGIGSGERVEVEWSYRSDAGVTGLNGLLPLWEEVGLWGAIGLKVRIRIADAEWVGVVAERPDESPYAMVVGDTSALVTTGDELEVIASSGGGALFSSFPGASVEGGNALMFSLRDRAGPYEFLGLTAAPLAAEVSLGEITEAGGEIRAGGERIYFSLDPDSVVVADGAPGEPVVPSIAVVGGEVTLGWAAEVGADYTIRWSGDGRHWEVLGVRTAGALKETYTFSPVDAALVQYYQVSRDG